MWQQKNVPLLFVWLCLLFVCLGFAVRLLFSSALLFFALLRFSLPLLFVYPSFLLPVFPSMLPSPAWQPPPSATQPSRKQSEDISAKLPAERSRLVASPQAGPPAHAPLPLSASPFQPAYQLLPPLPPLPPLTTGGQCVCGRGGGGGKPGRRKHGRGAGK